MNKNLLADGDVIAGGVTAALGVYILAAALQWDIMGPEGPGPGFFPVAYGAGLLALSLVLIFQRVVARSAQDDTPVDWAGLRRAGVAWIAFALAAALMPALGFFVSLGLLTVALSLVVFGKGWRTSLLNGALMALGFYLVFGLALDVSLPSGRLGF